MSSSSISTKKLKFRSFLQFNKPVSGVLSDLEIDDDIKEDILNSLTFPDPDEDHQEVHIRAICLRANEDTERIKLLDQVVDAIAPSYTDKYSSLDFNLLNESENPIKEIGLAFKDCFKEQDGVGFLYIRAADLAFARKDIEDFEVDSKENDLRSQCTLEILNKIDQLSHGKGRKTIIVMSLSSEFASKDLDETSEIPFFFASDRISHIITF